MEYYSNPIFEQNYALVRYARLAFKRFEVVVGENKFGRKYKDARSLTDFLRQNSAKYVFNYEEGILKEVFSEIDRRNEHSNALIV